MSIFFLLINLLTFVHNFVRFSVVVVCMCVCECVGHSHSVGVACGVHGFVVFAHTATLLFFGKGFINESYLTKSCPFPP